MNKESKFISFFENSFIGDDGAFVDGVVYSQDAFYEDVHFKSEWMSYFEIAAKSMLVNISDAIAMNAKPKYALLSVAMPQNVTQEQMEELARGFKSVADEYGCEIIGGDTISDDKLSISVTIISETQEPLYRKGLEVGDLVYYTGELGSVKKDLDILLSGGKIDKNSKFIRPVLRSEFVYKSAKYMSSGMDISDGLFTELGRLSDINSLGFEFVKGIDDSVGCSGEEYEMLFACKAENRELIEKIAKETNTPITLCATAINGEYKSPCKGHHF